MLRCIRGVGYVWALLAISALGANETGRTFRAGAFAQDVTPEYFPIAVNGQFKVSYATEALDPLHARCLVLDDGTVTLAMVVVDSCMLDRVILDEAKRLAHLSTGILEERIFISTTHCHSAPAAVSVLGTDYEPRYRAWLPGKIAEGIAQAFARLQPAQIGWGVGGLPHLAASRRWIALPNKMGIDPYGEQSTRATMHPGYRNPNWEEPSGPVNSDVNVIAVRGSDGTPLALYSSFSIHYVGSKALSADYFGVFADKVAEVLAPDKGSGFVAMMANGVSGDVYIRDYTLEKQAPTDKFAVGAEVAQEALKVYRTIKWHDWLPLGARQSELELQIREPKLEWATKVMLDVRAGREKPDSRSAAYAREHLILATQSPIKRLKLQTMRIGTLAFTGAPCEVFGITGYRIAQRSPFEHTFTVMLANGYEGGYLPPPEQLIMGGYTTWLARSSCLEEQAEPKVVATIGQLLKELGSDLKVEPNPVEQPAYIKSVLASKPTVLLPLDDLNGPGAVNLVDGSQVGNFALPTAWYMPGAQAPDLPGLGKDNRVVHFIGKPLTAKIPGVNSSYTVEMWFYNCMPNDARAVTGYLFGRGAQGDRLAIGGTDKSPGCLVFESGGANISATGKRVIPLRNWVAKESWHHVALVREGNKVTVYLNGTTEPELQVEAPANGLDENFWIGGATNADAGFEGRLDNVAIYSRALTGAEIKAHFNAAF